MSRYHQFCLASFDDAFEVWYTRKKQKEEKFAQTADDGKTYKYKFYSLMAIITVGYRTNSERAKQGYVLDKNRLINGQIFDEDYFEHLIAEIQEIRASERRFLDAFLRFNDAKVLQDKGKVTVAITKEFAESEL